MVPSSITVPNNPISQYVSVNGGNVLSNDNLTVRIELLYDDVNEIKRMRNLGPTHTFILLEFCQ